MPVGTVGRCEQCGLGYEVVGDDLLDGEVTCRDCGGPVYAVDAVLDGIDPFAAEIDTEGEDPQDCPACVAAGEVCEWHEGWQQGWDDCARVMASQVQPRSLGEAA